VIRFELRGKAMQARDLLEESEGEGIAVEIKAFWRGAFLRRFVNLDALRSNLGTDSRSI
jgi:hypothetical protein